MCNGKPVGGPYAKSGPSPGGEPPVYVVVSAGTLRDGSDGIGLYDRGLGGVTAAANSSPSSNTHPGPGPSPGPDPNPGECQRRLMLGQTTFSSLLFKHTSFNCDSRPFHLVVTVLAPSHHPLAARPAR